MSPVPQADGRCSRVGFLQKRFQRSSFQPSGLPRSSFRWSSLLRRRWSMWLPLAGVLALLASSSPASRAVPADGTGIPLPTRVERFNPDQQVCQPARIKAGFAAQLQPWADQPPAVLEQLRRVQLEMTRATLQRCVSKGLLKPAEAADLERQLLQPAAAAAAGSVPGAAAGAATPARP